MKLKFIAKIESNIKIKTNLKNEKNYNNPDTNIFHWRKKIRQIRWFLIRFRRYRKPICTGFVQMKPWLQIAVHTSCFALLT